MSREPTMPGKLPDGRELSNKSVAGEGSMRATLMALAIGTAFGLVASLAANGRGHASESAGNPRIVARLASSRLDTLQRLPESIRTSLQATKTLSAKDACRIAESLVREPAVTHIDTIAQYLSKDVHRWTDRMITLYLGDDPKAVKAADRNEMKKRLLQKWESDRGLVQRWLQGCGVVVRAAIGRGRPAIEREAPDVLADIVSVIAAGLRKNEPDAIAAAEALARAEETLRASLK
jgi:hypothetical protein